MRKLSITHRTFSDDERALAEKLGVSPANSAEFRIGLGLKGVASVGSIAAIGSVIIDSVDGEFNNTYISGAIVAGTALCSLIGSYLMAGPLQEAADAIDTYPSSRFRKP